MKLMTTKTRLVIHRVPPHTRPINRPSHIFYDNADGLGRIERLRKGPPGAVQSGWFSANWKDTDTWGQTVLQCWWDEPEFNDWGEVCP